MTRQIEPFDWQPLETRRLWDWIGSRPQMQQTYFTFNAGQGLVGFLACAGLLRGKALDYGCGPGFLAGMLAAAGLETHGADYSPKSIRQAEERLAGKANWQGAKLIDSQAIPFPDHSFDLVTCIETLEHVPETGLPALIAELKRVLKPGGVLLLTTPHEEDLRANMNYCPFCDTEFHRWQHLRSWNTTEVEKVIEAGGLIPLLLIATDFSNFQNPVRLPAWQALSIAKLRDWINFSLMQALDRYKPRPFLQGREFMFRLGNGHGPSLCVLATKQGTAT